MSIAKNYSKTSGKLWNYLRYGPNSSMVDDINYSISDSKYFGDKTGITGKFEGTNTTEKIEIVVHLKVQSCKLYNNKYLTALTQVTNSEISSFEVIES